MIGKPASVAFTFAEIESLTAESDKHDDLAQVLYLNEHQDRTVVSDSGLASLQVRGLGRLHAEEVELADEVKVIASLFDECDDWLDLVYFHDGNAASLFIGTSARVGSAGLLVAAESPGCYRCYVLEPSLNRAQRVASAAVSMAAAEGDNAMYVQRRGDDDTRFVVACGADGNWGFAHRADEALRVTTREQALHDIEEATERVPVSR